MTHCVVCKHLEGEIRRHEKKIKAIKRRWGAQGRRSTELQWLHVQSIKVLQKTMDEHDHIYQLGLPNV